jgi:hypothetical protein
MFGGKVREDSVGAVLALSWRHRWRFLQLSSFQAHMPAIDKAAISIRFSTNVEGKSSTGLGFRDQDRLQSLSQNRNENHLA